MQVESCVDITEVPPMGGAGDVPCSELINMSRLAQTAHEVLSCAGHFHMLYRPRVWPLGSRVLVRRVVPGHCRTTPDGTAYAIARGR